MPTPSETLSAIRGAAELNAAALSSISAQIPPWLAEVETWRASANKGMLRDQLDRVLVAYSAAEKQAERLVALATQALDQLGTGGDPDTMPPSVPWSTGELQVAFGVATRPSAGKELGRYLVVENITWDDLLSAAEAEVAATNQSDVLFSVMGVPIIRFRWEPGELNAVVTVLAAESVPGDVIVVTAPAVQDPTLSGIAGTAVGRRLGT
jgi:hypothetical protein